MNIQSILQTISLPVDRNFKHCILPVAITAGGDDFIVNSVALNTLTTKQVSIPAGVATLVSAQNTSRINHIIIPAIDAYIGVNNTVSATTGIKVAANSGFSFNRDNVIYFGDIYVYSATATTAYVIEYIV